MRAAELVRAGYAPVVLVSGPMEIYGVNEADLAIQFAVATGIPARLLSARLPSGDIDARRSPTGLRLNCGSGTSASSCLVTSDYHTRRAASIFRRSSVRGGHPSRGGPGSLLPRRYVVAKSGRAENSFYEYAKTARRLAGECK